MPRRVEAGGQPNLGCVTKDMGLARSTEISGFQMVMTSGQYVVKSRLGWHIDLCQEARKMTLPSESVWARVKNHIQPQSDLPQFCSQEWLERGHQTDLNFLIITHQDCGSVGYGVVSS